MEDSVLQLGGNIELSGFNSLDHGIMIVLKKIIGNYARKFSDKSSNFEKLSLHVKKVHSNEAHAIYELHAKMLDNGKALTASSAERNLFVAVDSALKGIDKQIK